MEKLLEEEEVSCLERVKCPCGSEVLMKNLKAHEKTKKHLNGGVVVRKGLTYDTTTPAKVAIEKTCLDTKQYKTITPIVPQPPSRPDTGDEDPDLDDDDEFEDIILEDIKTLSDKIDRLYDLVDAGFSMLLGDKELDDVPEGEEKSESK